MEATLQKHKNDGQTLEWVLGTTVTTLAALAATAVFNHFRAKRAEDASPPMGRFITVDGVRLHHVDRGQGRPVVLLHGNGAMIQDIEASGILTRAAEHYRVIAFDRPGFGYSERPRSTVWTPSAQAALLHNALKQLGIQEPVIVGHSWGALVAVAMALDFPADVAALALLSGYYFPTLRADTVLGSPPAIPVVGDVLRHTVSPLLGRLAAPALKRKLFGPSLVSRSFADFPMEIALRPSQSAPQRPRRRSWRRRPPHSVRGTMNSSCPWSFSPATATRSRIFAGSPKRCMSVFRRAD